MALSSMGPIIQSPPFEVHWDGFVADSRHLQQQGWECAVDTMGYSRHCRMVLRHGSSGVVLIGEFEEEDMRMNALRYSYPEFRSYEARQRPVRVHVRQGGRDGQIRFVHMDPGPFTRVSLSPNMMHETKDWTDDLLGLFTPWIDKSQEIIVEPQTVSAMLEQIMKLQSKDLTDIRQRNRQRDLRDLREQRGERVVAQVIALAA